MRASTPQPFSPSVLQLFAASSSLDAIIAVMAAAHIIPLSSQADDPLPTEFVWMPAGRHDISAFAADGTPWEGTVIADEAGARAVQATLAALLAAGHRVPLDRDHKDEEATAWVIGFRWDPALGILIRVEWTSLGESLLRGKIYRSFSPAFLLSRTTGRVTGFPAGGHAAGGLVNAPAFGTAMPPLIAARLAGAFSTTKPASGGHPDNLQPNPAMKDTLLQILAHLGLTAAADATDEQLLALVAKHLDRHPETGTEGQALKAQLAELQALQAKAAEVDTLRAAAAQRRKADASAAVTAAVARGALPPKDEALQAKWRAMVEANPDHAELLASLPANPALTRVTQPGAGAGVTVVAQDNLLPILQQLQAKNIAAVQERSVIWARDISPLFEKQRNFSAELGLILAANSLGTLSGELITQRSLTLLKRSFPELFAISTDFSNEAASFNQTVKARLRTIPTVTDYNAVTGYATSDAGAVDVPVVLNGHKAVQIAFNANELASTNRDLFGEQAEGAHSAIGADLIDTVLALITAVNFANATIQALAGFGRPTMTAMAKALTGRLVPRMNRFCMLNLDYHEKLGQDSSIVSMAAFSKNEIITDGELPNVGKLKPYEVQNFPVVGNLTGFAGTPDALALSTRIPNDYTQAMPDVSGGGVIQIVQNPDTKMSVMLVRFIDHKLGAAVWRLAYMRGAAVGQAASGQRLISA